MFSVVFKAGLFFFQSHYTTMKLNRSLWIAQYFSMKLDTCPNQLSPCHHYSMKHLKDCPTLVFPSLLSPNKNNAWKYKGLSLPKPQVHTIIFLLLSCLELANCFHFENRVILLKAIWQSSEKKHHKNPTSVAVTQQVLSTGILVYLLIEHKTFTFFIQLVLLCKHF